MQSASRVALATLEDVYLGAKDVKTDKKSVSRGTAIGSIVALALSLGLAVAFRDRWPALPVPVWGLILIGIVIWITATFRSQG